MRNESFLEQIRAEDVVIKESSSSRMDTLNSVDTLEICDYYHFGTVYVRGREMNIIHASLTEDEYLELIRNRKARRQTPGVEKAGDRSTPAHSGQVT